MTKQLNKSARIQSFGGKSFEKKAYALIGFSCEMENDSTIQLLRGEWNDVPKMLKNYGNFTNEDIERISGMAFKEEIWLDDCTLVIRIS